MQEATAHIGILYVELFMNGPQSLKEKRMILKSIKDKVRQQFNVSVAELGNQDKWQAATLGFCMIGNDNRYIDGVLNNILSFLRSNSLAEVVDHQIEFL